MKGLTFDEWDELLLQVEVSTPRTRHPSNESAGREKIPSGPRRHQTLLRGYYITPLETTRNRAKFAALARSAAVSEGHLGSMVG
jgi:hypothetical protein